MDNDNNDPSKPLPIEHSPGTSIAEKQMVEDAVAKFRIANKPKAETEIEELLRRCMTSVNIVARKSAELTTLVKESGQYFSAEGRKQWESTLVKLFVDELKQYNHDECIFLLAMSLTKQLEDQV